MELSEKSRGIDKLIEITLQSCKYKCSKVSFDLNKIRDLPKISRTYHIHNGEYIVVHCKSTLSLISLAVDGIIFTNRAIYIHPNSAKELPSNRFAYADLCNYLITQENERGSIHLQNEKADYQIYDSTLVFKNTAGKEILLILETIQEKLLDASPFAQAQFNQQVQWTLSMARNEMNHGILSARAKALLNVLVSKTSYKKDTVFLIAESIFRLCNRKKYQAYLDSVVDTLSPADISELQQSTNKFLSTLISQISDLDHSFTEEYLNKTYLNIEGDYLKSTSDLFNVPSVDEPYLHVLAYCLIRNNDLSGAQKAIERIRRQFGDEHIASLEYFKGVFRNRQMLTIYNAICAGKNIDKAWYSICDSYGLTLLHYTLILKNNTVAEHILTVLNSHKLPPLPEDIDISWMYDYTLLACGTQSKMKEQVFSLFDPDMIRLEKEIAKLKINVAKYDFQLGSISTMQGQCKNKISYVEQNDPFSSELSELYSQKDELADVYRDCLNKKFEAEKEVEDKEKQRVPTYNDAVRYALNNLDKLRNSEDPLARLLFRLYFEPDFLHRVLTATSEQENTKLYKYADVYFIAPDFAEIDPKLTVKTDTTPNNGMNQDVPVIDGYMPITPPYGTSWFSANAHSDVTILKTEYRALAKKYHPDVCQHPDSNTAMQQITAEYEALQRSI